MLPAIVLLALSLADLPLSSGLKCRHLEACVDNHANCSAMEENVTCAASTEFCFTLVFGNASGVDWRLDSAVLEVAKGCADADLVYPTCERSITVCHSLSCVACCDGDHCNKRDPRPTAPPTQGPTATSDTDMVTGGSSTGFGVPATSAGSEGPRQRCSAVVLLGTMLLAVRACLSEFLVLLGA